MLKVIMGVALYIFVSATTSSASVDDQFDSEQDRQQQQEQLLRWTEQMRQAAADAALVRWNKPVAREVPIYYKERISTLEDPAIFVALCGGDVADCKQAEVKLRMFSELCYVPMILIDLDKFDWEEEYNFAKDGETAEWKTIPMPTTIYGASDPSLVLLVRERHPSGFLGYQKVVQTDGMDQEQISQLACQ